MAFRIEMFYGNEWSEDSDLVNHSDQEENFFLFYSDALDVIDDLVGVGFIRERLRVAEID
jgi:hypothetical protein